MKTRYLLLFHFIIFSAAVSGQEFVSPPIVIGVTINESEQSTCYRGWPLLINSIFFNENAFRENTPVELSPGWETSFHIVVRDTGGNIISWPFHLAAPPAENVTLDSFTIAELDFWLNEDETNQIPAGDYVIIGILDSTAYPELGTNFFSASGTVHPIIISDEPAVLNTEQKTEKDLLFAKMNLLRGNDDKALEYLNEILGYNPENMEALLLTGTLFENLGDYGAALYSYSRAVDIFYDENPDSPEPPFELLHTQNDLAYKMDNSHSFNISMAEKDTSHPFYGSGSSSCYYIDNIPARELQLKRGVTYTFYMKNIPAENPFYFSADAEGGGAVPYTEGIAGTPADSNEIVTFTVNLDAPDSLYYQSYTNELAGWRINITDSSTSTSVNGKENIPRGFFISLAYPNPFNPLTKINISLNKQQHVRVKVFNIAGEELKTLFEGSLNSGVHTIEFNAAAFVSGIYLIRIEGEDFRETRKVVLLK